MRWLTGNLSVDAGPEAAAVPVMDEKVSSQIGRAEDRVRIGMASMWTNTEGRVLFWARMRCRWRKRGTYNAGDREGGC